MTGLWIFLVSLAGAAAGIYVGSRKKVSEVPDNTGNKHKTQKHHTTIDPVEKPTEYIKVRRSFGSKIRKSMKAFTAGCKNIISAVKQKATLFKQKHSISKTTKGEVLLKNKIDTKEDVSTVDMECDAEGIDKETYIKNKRQHEDKAYNMLKNKKE